MRAPEPIKSLLQQHPGIEQIEVLLTDISGCEIGKRAPVSHLSSLAEGRHGLAGCLIATDATGEVACASGYGGPTANEHDLVLRIAPESFVLTPWSSLPTAQVLATLQEGGVPFLGDPRNILAAMQDRLRARGLNATVAVELEFYLVDRDAAAAGKMMPPPYPGSKPDAYPQARPSHTLAGRPSELAAFDEFLGEVIRTCRGQGVPVEAVISEYGPAQFEINIRHVADAVSACDHAIYFKRAVKAVARRHGFLATFMAKPYAQFAGSGMHVHISVHDEQSANIFLGGGVRDRPLGFAIGGLLSTMPDLMAVFAPSPNSYRRFSAEQLPPQHATWGRDNRHAAIRIVGQGERDLRLEHRVAGADANPYLVVAAILGGILHGLDARLDPGAELEHRAIGAQRALPLNLDRSLQCFRESVRAREILSGKGHFIYLKVREQEFEKFNRVVTPIEAQWYCERV
jgi:glutamine synthetase